MSGPAVRGKRSSGWRSVDAEHRDGGATRASGQSAREAIMRALEQAGVELP